MIINGISYKIVTKYSRSIANGDYWDENKSIDHASDGAYTLCGKSIGSVVNGWLYENYEDVTCKSCLARIAKLRKLYD